MKPALRPWMAAGLLALAAAPARQAAAQEYVPGEVIVALKSSASEAKASALSSSLSPLGSVVGSHAGLRSVRMHLNKGVSMQDALASLNRRSDVLYAEPNYIAHSFAAPTPAPNDMFYSGYQYAPKITQTDLAWGLWAPHGDPVVVAIVDTGVDYNHPDLTNKIDRDASGHVIGYDFANNDADPMDDHGHGTHCAGIVGAQANNGIGVAGVAGWDGQADDSDTASVKIMPVKVLGSDGSGSYSAIAAGITWAADHGAKIISMSLGGSADSNTLENAIQYAWNRGCLVVAAAGNSGSSTPSYPGGCANTLSVASTDRTDTLSSFSNYGGWVKVAAPGSDIASTYPNNQYMLMSGTSMATPFVAGEAALLLSDVPTLTNSRLTNLITANVDPFQPYQGHQIAGGRVNVYKALVAATGSTGTNPAPAPTPEPAAQLAAISFDPSSALSGQTVHGTVTLTANAPQGGSVVTLTSSNANAFAVPASVTVPAGAKTVTFNVTVPSVRDSATVTITGSYRNQNKTVTESVKTLLASVVMDAASIPGGSNGRATINLNGPAPQAVSVTLTLTGDSHLPANGSTTVSFAAGSTKALVVIGTPVVAQQAVLTLTASCQGVTRSATLTVLPPALSSVRLSASGTTGTVALASAAPQGGLTVTLTSSNTRAATVPSSVVVPAGATTVNFPVTLKSVSTSTNVTLTAAVNNTAKTVTLTVRPVNATGR